MEERVFEAGCKDGARICHCSFGKSIDNGPSVSRVTELSNSDASERQIHKRQAMVQDRSCGLKSPRFKTSQQHAL